MFKELTYVDGPKDLSNNILNNVDKLLIFMFTANWCGPCKKIKNYILNNNTNLYDNMKLLCIDVDTNDELCNQFDIESMPTFIFNVVDLQGNLRKLQTFYGADSKMFDDMVKEYTKYIGVDSNIIDKYLDSLRK
jgi:thiol-disulfide isomerase/thioredoxin